MGESVGLVGLVGVPGGGMQNALATGFDLDNRSWISDG